MPPDIPDYYRQFADKPARQAPPVERTPTAPKAPPEQPPAKGEPPTIPFRGGRFSINLYEDWHDKTVYVLAGPVTDGVQHNITITGSPDVELEKLIDFADWQVKSLEENLKGCRLLLQEPIQLNNGMPAYRAIFVWYPTDELRIYQEQIYVLHDGWGYTITASFTKKTRKTIGPRVERMMRSFEPGAQSTPATRARAI